ncbi:hypothetical protein PG984_009117 [Apiospora sp. TS-2023a]
MLNPIKYDVIIIGGGHAGMSAVLTLYRYLYIYLILDTAKSRNAWPLPYHAEGRKLEELRAASRAELLATGLVIFIDSEVVSFTRKSNGDLEIIDS